MPEEIEPRPASPVVQLSLCQHPQQSGLTRVHIPKDSHPQVQELQEEKEQNEVQDEEEEEVSNHSLLVAARRRTDGWNQKETG